MEAADTVNNGGTLHRAASLSYAGCLVYRFFGRSQRQMNKRSDFLCSFCGLKHPALSHISGPDSQSGTCPPTLWRVA
ncbi:hypothetical protein CW304_32880 [Bacillus sp. UFRGS-B20]|nr:hypothetical protein CW304_32880 [Bacillus sp. UFRGS-B20]